MVFQKTFMCIALFVFVSCEEQVNITPGKQTIGRQLPVTEFKLSILKESMRKDYSTMIVLTDKKITVTWKGDLVGKKDTVVYAKSLLPSDTLKKISEINFDALKTEYNNPCIDDGLVLKVDFTQQNKTKTIRVENYYQEEIGEAIRYINSNLPSQYNIWYNQKKLVEDLKNCNSK
jgi:hypothetical protein